MKQSLESKPSSSHTSNSSRLAETHAGLVFVRRFQNALATSKLLPRGSKIVVTVSGGPDSMVLLTLLARLRKKHRFELHVAHVNYGLRGRDSDRDERLVQEFCETHALPLSVLYPKIKTKRNIEATLRDIRYTFFETLRQELKFDTIVTAHTMNDVAETVLMNLIRGAGPVGLSPLQRVHSHLVRPLIYCTRPEIEAFINVESIPFRTDRSNASRRFTRNRIRHELLPLLETFNPLIVSTLAATARHLARQSKKKPPAALDTLTIL